MGEIAAELLRTALLAGEAAGRQLRARQAGVRQAATKSSPTDPVTEADHAAERTVVNLLRRWRPEDAVLAEEGTLLAGTSGYRWVIDPLDGTVNYLYQRAGWAVSVAVEDADGAVAGVVVDPVLGETFHAVRGGGAFLGERRLRVNDPVPLERALVGTGFSYHPRSRERQARLVTGLLPAVRDIRRTGTCAGDLCALAAGRVDAFLEDELSHWDWAAGALIAAEAGAVVSTLRPAEERHGLLAAGPALHTGLRELAGD
ncbi:inositol monophosphatase family protein [Amycolatopsis aidingensis]|uniref:inositol monophosphatase family protein n=1 Tax=Amycolatopsis aidingensis TaxID=2842453 RepID=UPI001E3EC0A5|nr:inositol monophosphatase family protein [Amycolatopsis aidingensis]